MLSQLFDYDNSIWRFLGKLLDLAVLHLLWLVCCLPLVTAGAATTALYYVTLKMAQDRESHIVKRFFHSFRQNMKQSTIIGLLALAVGIILFVDIRFFLNPAYLEGPLRLVGLYISMALAVLQLCFFTYVFPIQSRFYNPLSRTFYMAAYMMVRHWPRTLALLFFQVLFLYLAVCYLPWLLFWGYAAIAFLNSLLLGPVLSRYTPSATQAEDSIFKDDTKAGQ